MWIAKLASAVRGLAFAPDGRTLYTAEKAGRVYAWDVHERNRRLVMRLDENDRQSTDGLSVTGDGRFLIVWHPWPNVWELGPEPKRIVIPDQFWTAGARLDASGRHLLALSARRTELLSWNIAEQKRGPTVARWTGPAGVEWDDPFHLSADGTLLAVRAPTGQFIVRETQSGAELGRVPPVWRDVVPLSPLLSPDGKTLFCYLHDRHLLDVPSGELRVHSAAGWARAFHPTAPIFLGQVGAGAAIISSDTGEIIREFNFDMGWVVMRWCFAPDGLTAAVGGRNGRFVVFDVDV